MGQNTDFDWSGFEFVCRWPIRITGPYDVSRYPWVRGEPLWHAECYWNGQWRDLSQPYRSSELLNIAVERARIADPLALYLTADMVDD